MAIRFPYSRPDVRDGDATEIATIALGQILSQGKRLHEFEAALVHRLKANSASVCSSGTAALHLLYMALKLGPEAGLITSPLTFLATANAARMCRAPVAFCDTDPETGLMTPETLEKAIHEADFKVRAATVVHLGGRVADMAGLSQVAHQYNITLLEDACHAPGAEYTVGTETHIVGQCDHSAAAAFSFHAIKHIAMGEGGAVLTNDPTIAERVNLLRNHGMVKDPNAWTDAPEPKAPWYYEMVEMGQNYRADEISCALGAKQLERLTEGLTKRRAIAERYHVCLNGVEFLQTPETPENPDSHAWHLYPIKIRFDRLEKTRGDVMRELADKGVETQVHYIPVHLQPYYKKQKPYALPGAENYYSTTLSIPIYPTLSMENVEEISDIIRSVIEN